MTVDDSDPIPSAALDALEAERKRRLLTILGIWVVAIPVLAYGWYWLVRLDAPDWAYFWALLATIGSIGGAVGWHWQPYRKAFKHGAVAPIVRAFDPSLEYHAEQCVPREVFAEARLFRELTLTNYSGEDHIRGTIGKTRFEFSEVDAEEETVGQNSKGERTTRTESIHKGLFFVADFNKHFSSPVYVLSRSSFWIPRLRTGSKLWTASLGNAYGEDVKLEDPQFMRMFSVHGDQVEARYILSAALMQRILEFRQRTRQKLWLGFVGSHVYVAIRLRRNLFEPRLFRTIRNPKIYRQFRDDLALFTGIVEDLNLNTRIWSKT